MAKRKTLFMETTAVEPEKTAAEIMSALAASGRARRIANSYNDAGTIIGLEFTVKITDEIEWNYRLPVRIEPVFEIINGRRDEVGRRRRAAASDREQATRTAWRQLYRWVQAQLAMIETGMVAAEEVFMPYRLDTARQKTMFEHMLEHEVLRIAAPASPEAES